MKRYKRAVWELWKRQWRRLALFEAMYRIFFSAVFVRLADYALSFVIRRLGYSYMTSENFTEIMSHSLTISLIAVGAVLLLFLTLFEVYAVFGCLEAAWRRIPISVPGMLRAGFLGSLRFIRRRPVSWIFHMAACFPCLWLFGSMTAAASRKLLQVTLEKLIRLFPSTGLAAAFLLCVFFASLLYTYTLPFRLLMEEREPDIRRHTQAALRPHLLRELAVNLLTQLLVLLPGILLFFLANLLVVCFAMLTKSPANQASAVIVYSDWVRVILYGGVSAAESVALLTYLYLFFCFSDRSGYHRTPMSPKKRPLLFRFFAHPAVAAVLTLLLLCFESGYLLYVVQRDLPSATMSSSYISVTAHRGGARKAPENTLSALSYAVESMSDYAEIDVQETADGEIVLLHDSNLRRTCGLNANIWTVTLEEVRRLDAGARFNQAFRGEPVPTLAEAIRYARGRIRLNIEVKYNGHNQNIVRKVVRIIEEEDFVDNCVLTSMNYSFLAQAKELNPDIRTGYTMKMTYGTLEHMEAADFFSVKYTYVTDRFVERAHSLGKEVCAWTLNYQGDMQRMAGCGVDNIITDDPELVRKVIIGGVEARPGFFELYRYALK